MVADGAGQRRLRTRAAARPIRRAASCDCVDHRATPAGEARRHVVAARCRRPRPSTRGLRLAAGHAESRRRLGCLRPQQRPRVPLPRAVCRSQRHDRPQHARPDRPRAGMLGQLGRRVGDPAVDRAVAYVRRTQERRRQLVRPLGRQLHLRHLAGAGRAWSAVGVPTDDPAIVAGANWLLAHQQACGGWGESPDSYAVPHLRGQGPATASQTAWAVMGLLAAGHARPSGGRPRHSLPAADAATTTARGTSRSSPAPASRGCSICATTTIRSTSRCWRLSHWAATARLPSNGRRLTRPAGAMRRLIVSRPLAQVASRRNT